MLKSLPTLSLFFLTLILSGEVKAEKIQMKVAVKPGVVFRDAPDLKGKTIKTLPFLKEVAVLDRSGPAVEALGLKSNWYKIEAEGKAGWVFGAFVMADVDSGWYEIADGKATLVDPKQCMRMPQKNFPRQFSGACLKEVCGTGCGNAQLSYDGSVSAADGCDGAQGKGKWTRVKNSIRAEYTLDSLPPREICEMGPGAGDPNCEKELEKQNQKKCGKKSGCPAKRVRTITMSGDNQFLVDGESRCIYPSP